MHTDISDLTLLKAWQRHRDAEAFHTIVERHARLVYNTCRHILRNDTDAADVSQECFLCLAATPPDLQYSLSGWLHRLATHRSLDYLKASNRRRDREIRYARETVVAGHNEQADLLALIDEAIDALPDDIRLPLVDHFFSQKSHQQVALELGVPRRTVSYRINSGIEQLRAALNNRGVMAPMAGLAALLEWQRAEAEALPMDLHATLGKFALAGAASRGVKSSKRAALALSSFSGTAFLLAVFLLTVFAVLWLAPRRSPFPQETAPAGLEDRKNEDSSAGTLNTSIEINAADDAGPERAAAGVAQAEIVGGKVTGRVYDADTDAPIQGATVKIAMDTDTYNPVATCTTDAEGHYATEALPPGAYMIYRGKTPGYGATSEKTHDKSSKFPIREMEGIRFRLVEDTNIDLPVRRGVVVSGTVIDKLGNGIPGVTVSGQTRVQNNRQTTITDKTGAFYMAGFSNTGDFCMTVHKSGYGRRNFTRLDLGYPGLENLKIELPNPARVSGRVADADGKPLAGARVIAVHADAIYRWPLEYPEAYTDAQGGYTINDLGPGQYSINVYQTKYDRSPDESSTMVYANGGDHVTHADITTNAVSGFNVSGIVTDAEGNPIPNGVISLQNRLSAATTTDAAGKFSMRVLGEGWFTPFADVPGFHTNVPAQQSTDITSGLKPSNAGQFEINSDRDDIHIVLNRNTFTLTGNVIAAESGDPIPNFEIMSIPGEHAIPRNTEYWQGAQRIYNKDGSFRLEAIAQDPGPCTILVIAPGYGTGSTTITVPGDATEANTIVTVSQRPPISGVVVDHQGVPVAGADIFATYFSIEMLVATSAEDGTFKATGISQDAVELIAFHSMYPPVVSGIPQNLEDTNFRFQFQPAGKVLVHVTRNGKPASMVTVTTRQDARRTTSARGLPQKVTNHEGIVEFSGLPIGECNVSAMAKARWGEGVSKSQTVEISAGRKTEVVFDLSGGSASIRGSFLHNGKPLYLGNVGYSINAGGDELNFSQVASQSDGHWEFSEVPPGVGTLRFFTQYEGGSIERLVTVELVENDVQVVDIDEGTPSDDEQYASLNGVVFIEGLPPLHTQITYEIASDDATLRYTTYSESSADEWQIPAVLSGTGVITVTARGVEGKEYEHVEELTLVPSESRSVEFNLTGDSQVEP